MRQRHVNHLFVKYSFVLFALVFFHSCEEDEDVTSSVITEEVLYISGENVTVVGRILTVASNQVTNHGFLISTSEQFNNPIQVDLGPKSDLGRYIAEINGLDPGVEYFCRSFMEVDGEQILGNMITFNSLLATVTEFIPALGNAGDRMEIIGTNFSENMSVFFNGVEAVVESVEAESKITVIIPPSADVFSVDITVSTDNGQDLAFTDQFEYITGQWEVASEFIEDVSYSEVMALVSGDDFYVGLGKNNSTNLANSRIWKADLITNEWEENAILSPGRNPFVAGEYFGSGAINFFPVVFSNLFYRFDGTNFIELDTLPFKVHRSLAFDIDNSLYVLGGEIESREYNDTIFVYDKTTEEWSSFDRMPFEAFNPTPNFTYNGEIYILRREDKHFWKYNLETKDWTQTEYALPFEFGNDGIAQIFDGTRLLVGAFELDQRMWELDLVTNEWKEKIDYPESQGDHNITVFEYDGRVYFLKETFRSVNNLSQAMKLWSFDPDKI